MKHKIDFFILMCLVCFSIQAQTIYDAKVNELKAKLTHVSGRDKVDLLTQLADNVWIIDTAEATKYAREALDLALKLKYYQGEGQAYFNLADISMVKRNMKETQAWLEKALSLYQKHQDMEGMVASFSRIGKMYREFNQFEKALEYFLKALKLCETNPFPKQQEKLSLIYYQIGTIYHYRENTQQALEYYQKSYETAAKINYQSQMAYALNNIGTIYLNLKEFPKALENYNQAGEIFKDINDQYGIYTINRNIGLTYLDTGNYTQALIYFKLAEAQSWNLNYKKDYCNVLSHMAFIYEKQKKFDQAQAYYEKAIDIAQQAKLTTELETIYHKYSDFHFSRHDFKKALEYFRLASEAKEKLIDETKAKEFVRLQEEYAADKRQRQIELLKQQNRTQTVIRNTTIIILSLSLALLALIFKKYLYLLAFWKKQRFIGQYRIIEQVGSGGIGVIYKTHSLKDKKETRAVKVLREEYFANDLSRKRFKHEGAIIDKLDHPHIVKIYERGEYKNKLYLVMEFLNGRTLAEKISQEGKIGIDEARPIMAQIAQAVAFIHEREIIHRDLKPANVMLVEKDGQKNFVKLLDFGLARMKHQTQLTQTGSLLGTINYMAPEQIMDAIYTPAGDVYALGILYYEMLTGKQAFTGDTLSDIINQILEFKPTKASLWSEAIPDDIKNLISRMMDKNSIGRPNSLNVYDFLITLNKKQNLTLKE